jgi:hypothetical protein
VQARLAGARDASGLGAVHALGQVLFKEHGFRGNSDDFYRPHNSCLSWGLEHRTGALRRAAPRRAALGCSIRGALLARQPHGLWCEAPVPPLPAGSPALLALIYLLVAQQLGLQAAPVLLPSHTFVAAPADSSVLLVDPFNGGQVCAARCWRPSSLARPPAGGRRRRRPGDAHRAPERAPGAGPAPGSRCSSAARPALLPQVCSESVTEARLNANWGFHSPLLHLDGRLPLLLLQGPQGQQGGRQLLGRLLANLREAYWAPLPSSGGCASHVRLPAGPPL